VNKILLYFILLHLETLFEDPSRSLIEGIGGLDGKCLLHKHFHELVTIHDTLIRQFFLPFISQFLCDVQVGGEELCHFSDFFGQLKFIKKEA
jgi:hypothetical protein